MVIKGGEFLIADSKPDNIFIPEDYDKEQKLLYQAVLDFALKKVDSYQTKDLKENGGKISIELMEQAGELGILGAAIPEEYGGEGLDAVSSCIAMENLGYSKGSFMTTFSAHTGIGSLPLVYFGNEEQKKKYLPNLASGKTIAAYCLTEADAGSDALNSKTTAVLSDDGKHYILNGEKIFITNGSWAEIFTVYAKVVEKGQNVEEGKFTAFLIEKSFPGISIGAEEDKMGIKGSSTTSVILKDCKVPVENVLFEVGKGHKIAFNILNLGRAKLGQMASGACLKSINLGLKQASERKQFGLPINSFGMIKNKLADMTVRSYMDQSAQFRVAKSFSNTFSSKKSPEENAKLIEEYAIECSIAKVYGAESLDICTDNLVQIYGGSGFIEEYPAAEMYRDARILRIFEGTDEINSLLMAGTLLKRVMGGKLNMLGAIGEAVSFAAAYNPLKLKLDKKPLVFESHMLKMAKTIFLTTVKAVMAKLITAPDDQELLALLSEIIMEIYVMESGFLRAEKVLAKSGEEKAEYHIAAVSLYFNDIMPKIAFWAKQALSYALDGDSELTGYLASIDKLSSCPPVNSVKLRRMIADRAIKAKKYIFS